MRSSKIRKRILKIVLFFAVILCINSILNYIFIPYSYVSVDYENMKTKNYDTVFIGTSHGKCGIDPTAVDLETGGKSINLCLGGEYLSYSYYMVKEVCNYQVPKRVVYEIDGGYWTTDEYIGTDSCNIYHEMPWTKAKAELFLDRLSDKDYRITMFPWYVYRKEYKTIPDNIENKKSGAKRSCDTSVFTNPGQEYRENGFVYRYPTAVDGKDFTNFVEWDTQAVRKENETYLKKLVDFCKEKGIELTFIITPVPEETKNKYAEAYQAQNKYFQGLARSYDVTFIDFNYEEMEGFDRSISSFVDNEGHMNGETAIKFSRILGAYIK